MKPAIHPNYQETSYTCACGNQVVIPSTHTKEVHVDICSNCHPLYTGKEKLIDTEGRIDKFRKKYAQKS